MSFRTHIILAVLVFLIASLCILHPVHAQYTVDGEDFTLVSPIRIGSPSNTTYAANHVDLNFTVKTFVDCHINNMTLVYSLDMKDNVTIPIIVVDVEDVVIDANGRGSIWAGPIWDKEHLKFYVVDAEDFVVDDDGREVINLIIGVVNLENLQKGSHSLTVYGIYSTHQSQKIGYDKQTVYFTTTGDATDPPIVTTDPPIVTTDPPIVTTDPPIATIYVLVVVVVILLIIFMFFILFTKWKRE